MSTYLDAIGQQLRTSGGDRVLVSGFDGQFEVVSIRPEHVAVIRNLAPGYTLTSSVPLAMLFRCRYAAEQHPHAGECVPPSVHAVDSDPAVTPSHRP